MKKLIKVLLVALCAAYLTGCQTDHPKDRHISAVGGYVNPGTGTTVIGKAEIHAVGDGHETAFVKYNEDTPLFNSMQKLHAIEIFLTGTNSVVSASNIVESIARAFVDVKQTQRECETASDDPPPDGRE